MSAEVAITVHQGCDVYADCGLCGADYAVIQKPRRPSLYSMQPGGLVPVCLKCAERDDPATAELYLRLLDGESAPAEVWLGSTTGMFWCSAPVPAPIEAAHS